MNITDEMLEAGARALARTEMISLDWTAALSRAVVEAVAPLIAAQALRSAVDAGNRGAVADLIRERADHDDLTDFNAAHRLAVDVLGLITNCPTCTGPVRETVDMVCQTCGTDYAPDPCCNAPNMVWEHSRAGKDHFRCAGCGGGMTKARATNG